MEKDHLGFFIDTGVDIFSTMVGLEPEPGEVFPKSYDRPVGEVAGTISLVGDEMVGGLTLLFPASTLLRVASKMLFEDFEEIHPDAIDCVGELTNMLCGGVKRRFGEKGCHFRMTQPLTIHGKSLSVYHMTHCPVSVIPFKLETGEFYIEAFMADIQGLQSPTQVMKRVSSAY